MSELVEKGHDVRVEQQGRLRSRSRKVTDERTLRHPHAGLALRHVEAGRVAVLVRTGMHVEEDPPEQPLTVDDLEAFHLGVPDRDIVPAAEPDTEKAFA